MLRRQYGDRQGLRHATGLHAEQIVGAAGPLSTPSLGACKLNGRRRDDRFERDQLLVYIPFGPENRVAQVITGVRVVILIAPHSQATESPAPAARAQDVGTHSSRSSLRGGAAARLARSCVAGRLARRRRCTRGCRVVRDVLRQLAQGAAEEGAEPTHVVRGEVDAWAIENARQRASVDASCLGYIAEFKAAALAEAPVRHQLSEMKTYHVPLRSPERDSPMVRM